eukprot:TRINITY_DN2170_c0_g2_i1.p1 TRINITY_DN2170_c0_g2~~TRINITY_DN2170_c0_g2_i1.p1  ORF type:complete len:72 (-),score=3.40 TRINITY_DN2170_c0_g2_i1:520-735(-)
MDHSNFHMMSDFPQKSNFASNEHMFVINKTPEWIRNYAIMVHKYFDNLCFRISNVCSSSMKFSGGKRTYIL